MKHLRLLAIMVIFFLLGFSFNNIRDKLVFVSDKESTTCKSFCNSIANTTYDHVQKIDGQAHCFCAQDRVTYNIFLNKTITWKQVVDAGIIRDLNITELDNQTRQQLILQGQG